MLKALFVFKLFRKNRCTRLPVPLKTRRQFLRAAAVTGVVAAAAIGADGVIFEPNAPRIVRRDLRLRRWPDRLNGYTIAVLSDFHYDPYFSLHPLGAAVGMVNNLRPDLIALGGDFVSMSLLSKDEKKAASHAEPCARLLAKMNAPHGLWAVMGNHDYFTDPQHVTHALEAQGIAVLANRSVALGREGARFWLAGVNDVLSETADLKATIRDIPQNEATVLLAHEPDYADFAAHYPVDLQLSGHSHGGQVRIPGLPPLYLPDLAKKYYLGLYQIGSLTLYTNAGLGTISVPVRLNCPPEITLLTIYRSERA
jgi:predicted MPP superfamily phosphohydrolase